MRPRHLAPFLGPLALLALAPAAGAQTLRTLVREDDPVIGIGLVQNSKNGAVNNRGEWIGIIDTDAAQVRDITVLRQGFPAIREDDPVATPAGAKISNLSSANLRVDDAGNLLWDFRIKGQGISATNDDCLYWNTRLLAQQRGLVNAPEITPVAVYLRFFSYDFVSPTRILLLCEIDIDPDTTAGTEDALVEILIDGFGILQETHVLMIGGQEFPTDLFPDDGDDAPQVFDRLPNATSFRFFGANSKGEFIWAPLIEGMGQVMMIGLDRVVAAPGQIFEAPNDPLLDGRNLDNFNNYEADINEFGDFVFTAALNGPANTPLADSNAIYILNGEKYVQEGDALPSLGGGTVGNQTAAKFTITNSGDLFWVADIRNTISSENQAYMRNKDVIVRKGQTFLDGTLITDVRTIDKAFDVSEDGRFWIGEVVLQGGAEALTLVDFGLVLPIPGCNPNAGTVKRLSGDAVVGDQLTFGFENGQEPGVTPFLFFSRNPILNSSGCGFPTSLGELFIGPPTAFTAAGPQWFIGTVPLPVQVPTSLALVDSTWYAQGLFADVSGTLPGEDFRLTNGLKIEIGAP